METRPFGRLGPVSALALGGGGTGQVWGATTRDEAVATVREAIASGITLLDVAPGYGDGEAERVVGEAFAGRLPAGVRLLTKCRLGAPPAADVFGLLAASLDASCERLRTDRVDLFVLHNQLVPDGSATIGTPLTLYREAVRPAFERLVAAGRIAAWGITAIGVPDTLLEAFADDPPPAVAQCVTNLLDSPGSMQRFDGPARPRELIAAAARRGIGVMGIRAVQAGALTDGFDRELPADHRDVIDYRRAEPFRALARELGASPAALAHRYALTMPGVSTVVLGVKNRAELRECIAAETRGPLDAATVVRIDAAARAGGAPRPSPPSRPAATARAQVPVRPGEREGPRLSHEAGRAGPSARGAVEPAGGRGPTPRPIAATIPREPVIEPSTRLAHALGASP